MTHRPGVQTRVDPHEHDLHSRTEDVLNRGLASGLELVPGRPPQSFHDGEVSTSFRARASGDAGAGRAARLAPGRCATCVHVPLQFSAPKMAEWPPERLHGLRGAWRRPAGKYLAPIRDLRLVAHLSQGGRIQVEDPPPTSPQGGVLRPVRRKAVLGEGVRHGAAAGWWSSGRVIRDRSRSWVRNRTTRRSPSCSARRPTPGGCTPSSGISGPSPASAVATPTTSSTGPGSRRSLRWRPSRPRAGSAAGRGAGDPGPGARGGATAGRRPPHQAGRPLPRPRSARLSRFQGATCARLLRVARGPYCPACQTGGKVLADRRALPAGALIDPGYLPIGRFGPKMAVREKGGGPKTCQNVRPYPRWLAAEVTRGRVLTTSPGRDDRRNPHQTTDLAIPGAGRPGRRHRGPKQSRRDRSSATPGPLGPAPAFPGGAGARRGAGAGCPSRRRALASGPPRPR